MPSPGYLEPYLRASERFGGGFKSLLWASPKSQAARFDAAARLCPMQGRSVLDAGCGRADFLWQLLENQIVPSRYIGIEAVEALADFAEARGLANARIIRGDFVLDRSLFDQEAEVIVFSGSLNTLGREEFFRTLDLAWRAAKRYLVFNFLCSPRLSAGKHLTWYDRAEIIDFAANYTGKFAFADDYLDGDCTMMMEKNRVSAKDVLP